jgi:hypothetical protein
MLSPIEEPVMTQNAGEGLDVFGGLEQRLAAAERQIAELRASVPMARGPRMDLCDLRKVVADRGWTLEVSRRWVGRHRLGVIKVKDDEKTVYTAEFAEDPKGRGKRDAEWTEVRYGSPPHRAFADALSYLRRVQA